MNVEPEDYPPWSIVPYYGAKILINDPNDYPETTIRYRYITLGESLDIKVEPMVFQSDSKIRRVDPDKRACWFHDEVVLSHTDRYSFETCNTECRMRNYLENCGCLPFKYPREQSTRICEFEDLECLHNLTVYITKKNMNCHPICYMECRDKMYSVTSDVVPLLQHHYPQILTNSRNSSELATLQVYFGKSNCNCYKLTLLIDVNQFVGMYLTFSAQATSGTMLVLMIVFFYFFIAVFQQTGRRPT
ncbi:hypothetical protein K1T71_004244 [Dendrolimus kikuchii]|uniref:Uncharacterized protein n=1 Tax=Dendrolimus kikuchii TaxID=765133 RepID=A0ACC1D7R8_9NEOP|nr:hypothetical protein K1T71_004244 [Dendrolimus kikuchii]